MWFGEKPTSRWVSLLKASRFQQTRDMRVKQKWKEEVGFVYES